MKVEVEVWFTYAGRRKRKRTDVTLREKVTVEAIVPTVRAIPALRGGPPGGPPSILAYWGGDGLLSPVTGEPERMAAAALRVEPDDFYGADDPDAFDDLVSTWGRDEAMKSALAVYQGKHAAAAFALVDGVLCRPCEEPVIHAKFHDGPDGGRSGWGTLTWSGGSERTEPSGEYRNVNRLAELQAAYGGERSYLDRTVEILVPEAFRYDDGSMQLACEAAWIVKLLRDDLGEADLSFFATYATARDSLAAWRRGGEFDASDVAAFFAAADLKDAARADWDRDGSRTRRGLAEAIAWTRFACMVPPPPGVDEADEAAIAGAVSLR